MEPTLVTAPHLIDVLEELKRREPIFHHPEFGIERVDFEHMTAPEFWEVGASGKRYSREFILDMLEKGHGHPVPESWKTSDFHCQEIAPDNYLITYTLLQGERLTRRATIWRRVALDWQIVYHQGTIAESI